MKISVYFSNRVGIRTCSDYSPFGVELDGRTVSNYRYRFGYQGSEKDDEVKGNGNSYTTEFRQLDPRLGRWLSVDPVIQPWQSSYCSMDNNPNWFNDVLGQVVTNDYLLKKDGKVEKKVTDDKFDRYYLESDNENKLIGQFNKNTLGLIALPNNFNSQGIKFKYVGSKNENYISGDALASLFAALRSTGIQDLSLRHWSYADGSSPSPSISHKKGNVGDLVPLRKDRSGNAVTVNDEQFDQKRNALLVGALADYGWDLIYSERDKNGYITPGTEHYDKTSRHNNHFHIFHYNPKFTIVKSISIVKKAENNMVPKTSQPTKTKSSNPTQKKSVSKQESSFWDIFIPIIPSFTLSF